MLTVQVGGFLSVDAQFGTRELSKEGEFLSFCMMMRMMMIMLMVMMMLLLLMMMMMMMPGELFVMLMALSILEALDQFHPIPGEPPYP